MTLHKVFVYGTLKMKEPNHSWFSKDNGFSKYLGIGYTSEKYPLIIGTKYNIPFLLFKSGQGHNVLGEIYEVDDRMLSNLDILEDHPNFYQRVITDIRSEDSGSMLQCWTYFIKEFKPSLLEKDMLVSYSTHDPHNLPYCERYLRDPNYNAKSDVLP